MGLVKALEHPGHWHHWAEAAEYSFRRMLRPTPRPGNPVNITPQSRQPTPTHKLGQRTSQIAAKFDSRQRNSCITKSIHVEKTLGRVLTDTQKVSNAAYSHKRQAGRQAGTTQDAKCVFLLALHSSMLAVYWSLWLHTYFNPLAGNVSVTCLHRL